MRGFLNKSDDRLYIEERYRCESNRSTSGSGIIGQQKAIGNPCK